MSSVAHLSTPELIRRMERAHEDQNLDDETFELEQRLSARGERFLWEHVGYRQHRIVIEKKEG